MAQLNDLLVLGHANFLDDIKMKGDILPQSNNAFNIGSTSLKWANIYAHNSIIVSDSASDEFYISGGGSIASRVTKTAGWARSYSWKQRSSASEDFANICQMGAFGNGSTLNYWYVGTGYENANTWLQVNASHVLTRVPVRLVKGHLYLEGSNAGSSVGNTTQVVFGTSSTNHIVISSNDKALVLNPTTSTTANQIVLYLNTQSVFPGGLKVPTDNSAVSYFNKILPNASGTYNLGAADNRWLTIYGHQLVLNGATNATMTAASTNPRITFAEETNTQPVHLIYTDYNDYRAPAGLKVVGGTEASPAWFEVEGSLIAGGDTTINGTLKCTKQISTDQNIYMVETGLTKGTNPSETVYASMMVLDSTRSTSAEHRSAMVQSYVNSSGLSAIRLYAYQWAASATAYSYIYVQEAQDGTGKAGSSAPFYGAVWNDYAEFRKYRDSKEIPYGHIVAENGDDSLSLASKRLQKGCNVCSDTFGFAIGETEENQMPIAVAGRALVYTYEERSSYSPGDAVCAAPGGTISKMTRQEIKEYPDCIIGYVSAIPDYEIWGEKNTVVDGRIWIKVI